MVCVTAGEQGETVTRLANNRKALIAFAIAVAFVTLVVPTCRMVGCSMEMNSAMGSMSHAMGAVISGTCGGEYVTTTGPLSIVPVGTESLLLSLLAALVAAAVLFSPRVEMRPVRFIDRAPPPPPEDPRGERFRV